MARTGRRTKLNPELCEAICKNIVEGNTLTYSYQKEGISKNTFYLWMKKGRESKTQSGKFYDFYDAVKKAQEEGKSNLVKGIEKHGKKNWQALAWLLERMYPSEFGRRENVKMEHKGKMEHKITGLNQLKQVIDKSLEEIE